MKIGILTFHNALNYGAVLQCYALQHYLQEKGHDVEVIDYRIPFIEEQKKLFSKTELRRRGFIAFLKFFIARLLAWPAWRKTIRVFYHFMVSQLHLSPRATTAADIPTGYDCILFGSDQIWSPKLCRGFDPVFWGQFEKHGARFVSYAASIGETSEFLPCKRPEVERDKPGWQQVQQRIKAFDAISVREKSFQLALQEHCGVSASVCLDPTLLVDASVFDKIAVRPEEQDYVFLFNVLDDPAASRFARLLANRLGSSVVIKGQAKPQLKSRRDKLVTLRESMSPEEFLGYIKYARCIVANSFHAIALSLVFQKECYALKSRRSGRVEGLLGSLGLADHIVAATEPVDNISSIDYKVVNERLASMRQGSAQFITSQIGK
ncbi:polysaccharide pyruvyl transferase family protein [Xylanibacter ruminicola]|uniref:Polysaccharide pyruvyl transferase n=1 Tax=Xylanibacter ruminicola TaxID=839 RepID=A0A1M6R9Y0_XYLRU|nr:polysaccharide pyruvyl transferase family protein [Xylanibacter ruminicola]SHK29289.1 Polysaccharide pyruvyl transferase [Xylanibacter ruminicola]